VELRPPGPSTLSRERFVMTLYPLSVTRFLPAPRETVTLREPCPVHKIGRLWGGRVTDRVLGGSE
jgi:hypothetical protein